MFHRAQTPRCGVPARGLCRKRCVTPAQASILRIALASRQTILVSGGTSSGKTTLLNALLAEPAIVDDRIVLIEDTVELQCASVDQLQLLTRRTYPAVTIRDLVQTTLRLRPDRIIIGEIRDGAGARDMLKAWNTVPPLRGRHWAASTINGNKKRCQGILINELYAGQLVWNRVRMVKNPDTGRRVSRPNPAEEWKRKDVPHLAIVDQSLFEAVAARKKSRTHGFPSKQRKPKRLLSGLLKCASCGGGLSVKDKDHGRLRIHCSTRRESGSCDNSKVYYLDDIEGAVLFGLQQRLNDPALLSEFVKGYQAERLRLQADNLKARAGLEENLVRFKDRSNTKTSLST